MKNKILSILLILSLIISMPAAFADALPVPDGEKAYEILTSLGLLDGDTDLFKSGEKVERAELVRLITKVCGILPIEGESAFGDVDTKSDENKYILAAAAKGLIHGDDSGNFYPYEIATQGQLLKISATALGYEYYASVKGGWQDGYYKIADRAGLTENLHINMNAELTYDFLMVMLLNLAKADIMETVGFSGTETEMAITEGRNILSAVHDIYMMEDVIVEATPYTHLLASDSQLAKGRIIAGGKEFKDNTDIAVSLIGQTTNLYYRETADENALLLYIEPDEKHNKLIKLEPSSVLPGDYDTFRYLDDNERIKSVSLADNITPLLNGKLCAFNDTLFDFEVGEITLIDNNNDRKFDVINVMSYTNMIVSGIDIINSIVVAEDGTRLVLDSHADEYDVVFIKDNEYTDLNAVKKDCVISVAESDMKKGIGIKTVLISEKEISGQIEEVLEDAVVINGEEIPARLTFLNSIGTIGEGTYKTDAFGYIVSMLVKTDMVYGFLKHMYKDDYDDVVVRIFTEKGNWVDLKFREKVRYNGETKEKDFVYSALGGEDKGMYRQLVRYNVNSIGEITNLKTAKRVEMGTPEEDSARENDTFRLSYNGSLIFRENFDTFDGVVLIGDNTKVFDIPADIKAPEEKYHILGAGNLNGGESYQIKAYDTDEITVAGAVVTTSSPTIIDSYSKFMIVYQSRRMLNKDGDTVDALKGYWNGVECSIPVKLAADSEIKNISDLKRGDVVRISFDADGNIVMIMRYQPVNGYYLKAGLYSLNTIIGGEIQNTDTDRSIMLVKYQQTGNMAGVKLINNIPVTIYDSMDGKCYQGSFSDIIKGDKIIASLRQLIAQEIVVIR